MERMPLAPTSRLLLLADRPGLQLSVNPLLSPATPRRVCVGAIERELERLPHLAADRRHLAGRIRRRVLDARKVESAAAAIGRLPAEGEAVHLVVAGRFALWHLVPAAIELAGLDVDELTIATLGFSRDNVDGLCGLLDAGRIRQARLLASHYFKGTSAEIYGYAAAELARRPDRAAFLSVRTHAKLLLVRFAGGGTLAVESSANLRSCKNLEQVTLIGDAGVYQFHWAWIDELFRAAAEG